MKHACNKKMIILTTICARESQISVSTSTSNVPKHYCGKILSLYDRKTIFNTGEEPTPEKKSLVPLRYAGFKDFKDFESFPSKVRSATSITVL